jgi:hypothetical protein
MFSSKEIAWGFLEDSFLLQLSNSPPDLPHLTIPPVSKWLLDSALPHLFNSPPLMNRTFHFPAENTGKGWKGPRILPPIRRKMGPSFLIECYRIGFFDLVYEGG